MDRKFINFAQPKIEGDEIREVVDCLNSGWITTGPKVTQFENDVCNYVEAKNAVATFSCTSALWLTLRALGVGEGDEVIVPTFTFASTAHVAVYCGAKPVFVDIDPATLVMDVDAVEKAITAKTRLIIPVHYGGNPVDMDSLLLLADRFNLKVVEDAAHAIGSSYQGSKIGSLPSDGTCFSFYATKNLATAEGGMLVTDDPDLASKVKKLTMYGISDAREIWGSRYTEKGSWYYDVEMIGQKANMTDINAALGIHQLKKLDQFNRIRTRFASKYVKNLESTGCRVMKIRDGNTCCWHAFPIVLPDHVDRDDFIVKLKMHGIGTSVLFRPLHLHTAYKKLLGSKQGDYPIAESVYNQLVNLPISPSIGDADVDYVVEVIRMLLSK